MDARYTSWSAPLAAVLNIRDIGDDVKAALALRAQAEGVSQAELARRLLAQGLGLIDDAGPRVRPGLLAGRAGPLDPDDLGNDPDIAGWPDTAYTGEDG